MALVEVAERRNGIVSTMASDPESALHRFSLSKKSGGTRQIVAPQPRLKQLQKEITRELTSAFRWPPYLFGGIAGRCVEDHAKLHLHQAMVAQVDIKNFFPSVGCSSLGRVFAALGFTREDATTLISLSVADGALAQGFPQSPMLANAILLIVDDQLYPMCRRKHIRYSRYIDDISISSDEDIRSLKGAVRQAVARAELELNEEKTTFVPSSDRQVVGGLVVNDAMRPTSEYVRRVKNDVWDCLNGCAEAVANREGIVIDKVPGRLRGQVHHIRKHGYEVLADKLDARLIHVRQIVLSGRHSERPSEVALS